MQQKELNDKVHYKAKHRTTIEWSSEKRRTTINRELNFWINSQSHPKKVLFTHVIL